MDNVPDFLVFMKVGNHAGETFDQILERKQREIDDTGKSFWGYGGNSCHPLTQVQPFVKSKLKMSKSGSVYLLMQYIDSTAPVTLPAKEFSADGLKWEPIPEGIRVTGSRYALVLGEITPGELVWPMDEYTVGVGPSKGTVAPKYLQGRVDKGCFERTAGNEGPHSDTAKISYTARLDDPYAVILR
jgi:hypothetical protein